MRSTETEEDTQFEKLTGMSVQAKLLMKGRAK